MNYNNKQLCLVRDHKDFGEIAAICTKCYDQALRQQANQRDVERKREHEKYLQRPYPKAA